MMITLMYTHLFNLKVWKECKVSTNGFYLKRRDKERPIKLVTVKQDLWDVRQ